MKKASLIVLAVLSVFSLHAKDVSGKIIFKDSIAKVTFKIPTTFDLEPNYVKLQRSVTYYDINGKKNKLWPENAKEIQFDFYGKKIRMLSKPNDFANLVTSTYIFLKIEIDGELKLFNYFQTGNMGSFNPSMGGWSGGYSYNVENYVLQKGDGVLKKPVGLTFKKDMTEYFKECPELVEKIQNKEFRKNEMEEMVEYYNTKCK